MIEIYTDGSCLGNPGHGGWAFVVVQGDGVTSNYDNSYGKTTNNIMELTAVIRAMQYSEHKSYDNVRIFSDSMYVINGVTSWLAKWRSNGWQSSTGGAVKNIQLWQELAALLEGSVKFEFEHVKAHSTNFYNNMVDKLAREAAEGITP